MPDDDFAGLEAALNGSAAPDRDQWPVGTTVLRRNGTSTVLQARHAFEADLAAEDVLHHIRVLYGVKVRHANGDRPSAWYGDAAGYRILGLEKQLSPEMPIRLRFKGRDLPISIQVEVWDRSEEAGAKHPTWIEMGMDVMTHTLSELDERVLNNAVAPLAVEDCAAPLKRVLDAARQVVPSNLGLA
jgi:hypothetical protein